MKIKHLIFSLICLFLLKDTESKTTTFDCQSPENKKVEWYVIFLFPSTASKSKTLSYGYFDNLSKDLKYYKFENDSFPPLKIPTQLDGIDANADKVNYFFWNDDMTSEEQKKSAGAGKAHSKGGLAYDKDTGYFLLHSLPRFPKRNSEGVFYKELPDNAGKFGQTFICLSLDKDNSVSIVDHLNIINPQIIVKHGDTDNVDKKNDAVAKFIKNRGDSKLPTTKISTISTNKEVFTFFAKGKNYDKLPYDTLIPEHYKDGLFVETWTKPAMLDSICDGDYEIVNVENLKFGEFEFDKNMEHSKWAVSKTKNIACFGDLNRTESQKNRGGLTVCFENKKLADLMKKAIVNKESCNKKEVLEFLELIE